MFVTCSQQMLWMWRKAVNIADFARSHDASPDAVRMWISRNPDKFPEGAITRKSGHRDAELSAAAVAVLEQAYPLPKPVQVVQHDPQDLEELRQETQYLKAHLNSSSRTLQEGRIKIVMVCLML